MIANEKDTPHFELPPGCKLIIKDKEIHDLYVYVISVTVEADRNKASTATIEFSDRIGPEQNWIVQDDSRLSPGAAVKIVMTFDQRQLTLFTGYLVKMSSSFTDKNAKVTIECQDETLKLDQNHKQIEYNANISLADGEIVANILKNYDIPSITTQPGLTAKSISQNGSDIQLINSRAKANGFEFYIHNGAAYFGPMQLSGDPQAPDILINCAAANCINFEVSNDVRNPITVVYEITHPSENGEKPIVSRETLTSNLPLLGATPARNEDSSLGESEWYLGKTKADDEELARASAKKKINEASMRIKATGELDGLLYNSILRTGRTVTVVGAGLINSGVYYVDSVSHKISSKGYYQKFKLLRNAISTTTTKAKTPGRTNAVYEDA